MATKKRADWAGTQDGSEENNTRPKIALSEWTERHFFLTRNRDGSEEYYARPPVHDRRIFFLVARVGPREYCYAGWGAHPSVPWEWRQRHLPPGEGWAWDGKDGRLMLFWRPVRGRT